MEGEDIGGDKMSLDFYLQYHLDNNDVEVFWKNITHNLNTMADKAGIYKALWRPEEIGAKKAKDVIKLLERGLKELKSRPEYFKKFNPPNGWGDYEGFLKFVESCLEACKKYPNAEIYVSR